MRHIIGSVVTAFLPFALIGMMLTVPSAITVFVIAVATRGLGWW